MGACDMLYLNQTEYSHMKYPHAADQMDPSWEKKTVASSGCGICSMCMIVEHLTCDSLSLEECVRLAVESGASHNNPGTEMLKLAPVVCEKFGLEFVATNSVSELLQHLHRGGEAMIRTGGDREGYVGLFSRGRHYVTVISANENEICVLDPSFKEGKYDKEGRKENVRVDFPYLYCNADLLEQEIIGQQFGFYLFKRKGQ